MVVELMPLTSGFLAVYTATVIYRFLYPKGTVRWAMEVTKRAKLLEEEAARSKRAAKKLREMGPEYRRARSILFRSTFLKLGLLMVFYVIYGLVTVSVVPTIPSPIRIPLITVEEGGILLVPSLHIHFFSFAYTLLMLRDELE